jgi:hypothetical protein
MAIVSDLLQRFLLTAITYPNAVRTAFYNRDCTLVKNCFFAVLFFTEKWIAKTVNSQMS